LDAEDLLTAWAADDRIDPGGCVPVDVGDPAADYGEGLGLFATEHSEGSPAALAGMNALDLFPSESAAEPEVADSSTRRVDAGEPWNPIAEFDRETDEDVGRGEVAVLGRLPAATRWAGAPRVAVMLATATFVLQTSIADDPVRHRSLATAQAVATEASAHPERIAPRILSVDVKATQTAAPSDDARRNIPAMVARSGRSSQTRSDPPLHQRAEVVSLRPAGPETAAVETATPLSAPAVVPDEPAATTIETAAPFRSESSPSPSIVSSASRAPSSEVAVAMTETAAVRTVLNRYQRAFSDLDAGAAKTIWPSVDERGLSRAFGQLERQQIILDACNVEVVGEHAAASCGGRATYVPRVGSKAARVEIRRWAFTLRKTGYGWIIETIDLASR
jgi:hypothetical protein